MARAPAAAVSGLNCSESAVAGPAAAAASRETRGAGPGQTKLQARRADCSHCRRGINARPHTGGPSLQLAPASQGACSTGQLCSNALQCTHHSPGSPQPKYTQLTILQIGFASPPPPPPLASGCSQHFIMSGSALGSRLWPHEMVKTIPPMP